MDSGDGVCREASGDANPSEDVDGEDERSVLPWLQA